MSENANAPRLFFSGRTLQHAVLSAARHFQLSPDEVSYQARERKQGFVKSPKVVIEVDPAAPRRMAAPAAAPPPAAPRPVAPRAVPAESPEGASGPSVRPQTPAERPVHPPKSEGEPRVAVAPEEARVALQEVLQRLCRLAALDLAVEVEEEGSGWRTRLVGADEKRLGQDVALVDALEHLVPRLLRGLLGTSLGVRIVVGEDALRRERELRELAEASAREAMANRSAVTLPRLNSFERRIVHMVVASLPGVVSESTGEGSERRLVIRSRERST